MQHAVDTPGHAIEHRSWTYFCLVSRASCHLLLTHDPLGDFLVQSVLILTCIPAFFIAYVVIERPCMDPACPQKLRAALSRSP